MHPASIFSYYPTYSILDEIVSINNYDTLHIYVDLKNCLQSLYMEHTIVNIVNSSKILGTQRDSTIFTSVLSFLSFHKLYAAKRNIKIKFFLFFESGESYYHTNISKRYKISRRIDDLYGLDAVDREVFFDTVRQNLNLIENALNRVPSVKVLRLLNFEADFIPYYLITRKLVDTNSNVAHITYSNDHDLQQTIGDHSYIYSKTPQSKKIIKKGDGMKSQLRCDCCLPDEMQPLAIAILGDPGDDVEGIKGVGPKRFLGISDQLIKMTGGMDKLYDNVMMGREIFDPSGIFKNKYLNKVIFEEKERKLISNNLKLVSFELISRVFEDPPDTEILSKKKKLSKILNDENIVPLDRVKNVLEMWRIDFLFEDLSAIYHGYMEA